MILLEAEPDILAPFCVYSIRKLTRPGCSPHQALDALYVGIQRKRVNWVLDADIRGFFDNLSHAPRQRLQMFQWAASQVLILCVRTGLRTKSARAPF